MLITERLQKDAQTNLRQGNKKKLAAIRLIIADQRRIEIDTRLKLDDSQMINLLEKMRKQRQESITQFSKANRQDLIDIEEFEIEVIQSYLPQPLDEDELDSIINEVISTLGATTMSDMGKVIGLIQPKVVGRADMRVVSNHIKQKLGGC